MNTINLQRGFTMIEVLVSVTVLSIGLLGIASLQATGQRNNHSAYMRSQATALAYDMLDRMRANQAGVNSGAYNAINTVAQNYTDPGCAANCSNAQMAAYDAASWESLLANQLPAGNGTVTVDATGTIYTVTVMWDDNRNGAANLVCGANALTCFSVSSRI